jgi:GxxExxY protein
MTSKFIETPYNPLTYKIIGGAMAVHKELGPGLRENSYQRSLVNHFSDSSLSFEEDRQYPVFDDPTKEHLIGYYIPDFVVEEAIIVEIKALKGLDNSHVAQVISYLAVSGTSIGLLINFGERSLQYRRIFPPKKVQDHFINRQWLFVPDWLKQSHDR